MWEPSIKVEHYNSGDEGFPKTRGEGYENVVKEGPLDNIELIVSERFVGRVYPGLCGGAVKAMVREGFVWTGTAFNSLASVAYGGGGGLGAGGS